VWPTSFDGSSGGSIEGRLRPRQSARGPSQISEEPIDRVVAVEDGHAAVLHVFVAALDGILQPCASDFRRRVLRLHQTQRIGDDFLFAAVLAVRDLRVQMRDC
jgi:hypothetical protein